MEEQIEIYKSKDGQTQIDVRLKNDSIWLNQSQLSDLFQRDQSVISRHINNIFEEGELEKDSNMQKMHIAKSSKPVTYFNLDIVISVGYRIKSKIATEFRKWATDKLKEYLIKGYTINQDLLKSRGDKIVTLERVIDYLKEESFQKQYQLTDGFLSIISHYSKSFELLNQYDTETLSVDNLNKDIIYIINYKDVRKAIEQLKKDLIEKGEAGELFGNEKDSSFEGMLGSISQTVFGELA